MLPADTGAGKAQEFNSGARDRLQERHAEYPGIGAHDKSGHRQQYTDRREARMER